MFKENTNIIHEVIDGQDCIIWQYFVEDVANHKVTALVTPSGLMMLPSHSTIRADAAAGVMLDMARWWRRNKPTD